MGSICQSIKIDQPGEFYITQMKVKIIDGVEDYINLMQRIFDFDRISFLIKKDFPIAFDALNAVTGPYAKELFENILGYYRDTLSDINEHGYARVVSDVIAPDGNAILNQFSTDKETWTEKLFRGSASSLQRIFGMQTSK